MIQRVGFRSPIQVDEEGEIIAGHGRLTAAEQLGMVDVPVLVQRGLTDRQKRELRLADNRLAELAETDEALLLEELEALGRDGSELWAMGFDGALEELNAAVDKDGGKQPPEPTDPVSVAGEVYRLGPHVLVCGDSTQADVRDAALDGAAPRLWLCDPPFDLAYEAWALLPSIDVIYAWHRSRSALSWFGGFPEEWGTHSLVYTGGVRGQHRPSSPCCMHENVTVLRKRWWGKQEREAIDASVIKACGCECTKDYRPISWQQHSGGVLTGFGGMSWSKPVLQCEIAMSYVPHGSHVWDPCAGSGSGLIAADKHGRVWHGVELQPKWADLIRVRWARHAGETGQEVGDGLPG
jgi:hypothetical protein